MCEQQNRHTLERYSEAFERQDPLAFVELLHDDYVEEFPLSGERIHGKDNWRKISEDYPGLLSLVDHSYKISGDLSVVELTVDYRINQMHACEVAEFEDGKVQSRRAYFGEPFDAPRWSAQWVKGCSCGPYSSRLVEGWSSRKLGCRLPHTPGPRDPRMATNGLRALARRGSLVRGASCRERWA